MNDEMMRVFYHAIVHFLQEKKVSHVYSKGLKIRHWNVLLLKTRIIYECNVSLFPEGN